MENELIYICEICQTVLDEHHCKAVCPNCGRMFDCSDLPLIQANAKVENDHLVPRTASSMNDLLPKSAPEADPPAAADNGNVANLP
jgi:hypothetical protein